jgi:hypothetical protein
MDLDEKLAELKTAHGARTRLVVGAGDEWAVALVPPKPGDAKMYKHMLHDPAQRADAQEVMFRKMIVWSWTEALGECESGKFLESYPLAPEGCTEAIGALAGLTATARAKT